MGRLVKKKKFIKEILKKIRWRESIDRENTKYQNMYNCRVGDNSLGVCGSSHININIQISIRAMMFAAS